MHLRIWASLGLFVLALSGVVYLLFRLIYPVLARYAFLGSLIILVATIVALYFRSDGIVIRMVHGDVKRKLVEVSPETESLVGKLASAAGLSRPPKLLFIPGNCPNSLAVGRRSKSTIMITRVTPSVLDPDEFESLLAHEITHIARGDSSMLSVVACIPAAITYPLSMEDWNLFWAVRRRRRIAWSVLAFFGLFLVPLAALITRIAVSSSFDQRVDEKTIELYRKPYAFMSALSKIEASVVKGNTISCNPTTSPLWVVEPFREGIVKRIFSTHLSSSSRIKHLQGVIREKSRER